MAEKQAKKRLTKEETENRIDHLKILYTKENISTIKELAVRVGLSEKTVSKYLTLEKEGWDKLKKNLLLTREELMTDWLDELLEINKLIKDKPAGSRYADSKLADVRTKLRKDIKEMELSTQTHDKIAAMIDFVNFVRQTDLPKAQELIKYCDAYVKSLYKNKR